MSIDLAVYRSTDPSAVGAFDRASQDRERLDTRLREFFHYHPEVDSTSCRIRNDGNRLWVIGFRPRPEQRRAPTGWCRNRGHGLFVPSSKTAAGRQIRMELEALPVCHTARHYLETDAGMPSMHQAESDDWLYAPGAVLAGQGDAEVAEVWVRWTCDTSAFEPNLPSHWERVSLSRYYGLVESGRDPFAPVAPKGSSDGD